MNTTSLYVELIIIGAQVLTWFVLILDCFYMNLINKILNTSESVLGLIIFLISTYILGLLFDKIADAAYQNTEDKFRCKSGIEAKSSLLIEETMKMHEFQLYSRSKIRIFRATSLNVPMIAIAGIINLYLHGNLKFSCFIIIVIVSLIFTAISVFGTRDTLKKFYDKARLIELSNKENLNNQN